MEEKFCPCCDNRCPVDNLSCGRGRAHFGISSENGNKVEHGAHNFVESSDYVVNLLLKCGHALHHSSRKEDIKFDFLSNEDREKMVSLLEKCLSNLKH